MKRPNVLILFSDQQRYDTVGSAGFDFAITPNIDRLAKQGTLYTNAYSSYPLCIPARHDLITGLSARFHGYHGNFEGKPIADYAIPTLPRLFTNNGYRTAAIGKMHFCPTKEHHGFGEMYLMEELPKSRYDDAYATYLKEQGLENVQNLHGIRTQIYHIPQVSIQPKEHHGTMWVANKTIEWIENHLSMPEDACKKLNVEGSAPFFLMCGFIQPHPPWNIPTEYHGIYQDKKLPPKIQKARATMYEQHDSDLFGDSDSPEHSKAIKEAYYTAVTMVDEAVGKILGYLEQQGLMDDTIILFNSDHGEQLGDRGYFTKAMPYESSAHVPFILHYPKLTGQGEICKDFVDTFDIMPTLLDACSINYPQCNYKLIGESLFKEKADRTRRRDIGFSVGIKDGYRWVMARDLKYKFIHYYNGGLEEFYDLETDPQELVNLIQQIHDDEALQERYRNLKDAAIEFEELYGLEGCIADYEFQDKPFELITNPGCGKYPPWLLSSLQRFFEGDRAKVLHAEMQYALSNPDWSQIKLGDTYRDPQWVREFCNQFCSYTGKELNKEELQKLFSV